LANLIGISDDSYDLESGKMVLSGLPFMYGPDRVQGSFVNFTGYSSLGQFASVSETQDVPLDEPVQGFDKSFTVTKHGLRVRISDEVFDDDQDAKLQNFAQELGRSGPDTIETQLATILDNAFGTETSADGQPVCDAAHLTAGAGTFQNEPTTAADLSFTSLEQAYIDIGNFIDERGKLIQSRPQTILVSTEFLWTAQQILQSAKLPGSANNDINPAQGLLGIQSTERISDTDAWFVFMEKRFDGWVEIRKKNPTMETPQRNIINQTTEFVMTYRRAGGFVNPRVIYGNPGA
jgi:hypothetical protein